MSGLSSTEQTQRSSVSSNTSSNLSSNQQNATNESKPLPTENTDTNNPESNSFSQSLGAFRYRGVEGRETRGRGGYQVVWESHQTTTSETQQPETTERDPSDRSRYDY